MIPGDPPGGLVQDSKIIGDGLEGPYPTRKVGKKCSDMILSRPGTILKLEMPFWR